MRFIYKITPDHGRRAPFLRCFTIITVTSSGDDCLPLYDHAYYSSHHSIHPSECMDGMCVKTWPVVQATPSDACSPGACEWMITS